MDVMGRFDEAPGHPFCRPGDIYFTRSTAMLGRAIRWAERDKDEEESWANHIGGVTTFGFLVPPHYSEGPSQLAMVSEALWRVKHHFFWDHYDTQQGTAVAVFRPRNTTVEQRGVMINDWLSRTGQRYGWWRLFTFLGERLTRIPFTKLHFQDKRIVCSNHIALGAEAADLYLGGDPNELDPDDVMDYMYDNNKRFEFVGWSIVAGRNP